MNNEDREIKVDAAEKEIVELRRMKADYDKRYFKLFKELVTVCIDERGSVQWDYIEQVMFPQGTMIMTAYPPGSRPKA